MINQHGVPRNILSDNQFDTQLLTQFTKGFKIHQTFISPYHPQTNGMVERLNGTFQSLMRTAVDGTNWVLYLQTSTSTSNIRPNPRDVISPLHTFCSRHFSIPCAFEVEFLSLAAGDQAQSLARHHLSTTRILIFPARSTRRKKLNELEEARQARGAKAEDTTGRFEPRADRSSHCGGPRLSAPQPNRDSGTQAASFDNRCQGPRLRD